MYHSNDHIWERNGSEVQNHDIIFDNVTIVNQQLGNALNISSGCTNNSDNVQIWEKNGNGSQVQRLGAGGEIINLWSGKALDCSKGATCDGTHVQERYNIGAQKWNIKFDTVSIVIPQLGNALDVRSNGTHNSSNV
eukprot:5657875-Ditylum_brightwellii.AAC.1